MKFYVIKECKFYAGEKEAKLQAKHTTLVLFSALADPNVTGTNSHHNYLLTWWRKCKLSETEMTWTWKNIAMNGKQRWKVGRVYSYVCKLSMGRRFPAKSKDTEVGWIVLNKRCALLYAHAPIVALLLRTPVPEWWFTTRRVENVKITTTFAKLSSCLVVLYQSEVFLVWNLLQTFSTDIVLHFPDMFVHQTKSAHLKTTKMWKRT